jgi:hypothetical protein
MSAPTEIEGLQNSIHQDRAVKLRIGRHVIGEGEDTIDGTIGADACPVDEIGRNLNGISVVVVTGELNDDLAIRRSHRTDGIQTQQRQELVRNGFVGGVADAVLNLCRIHI